MSFDHLLVTRESHVGTVVLDRPERMNSLNRKIKEELALAIRDLSDDPDVRVVVLTGAGERAFCAGRDIKEPASDAANPSEFLSSQKKTVELFRSVEVCPKPTIAAINGVALGGGAELALCCDIRVMAEHAKIGLPEVNLGAMPAGGGTQRLPRIVGASLAKEMLFLGTVLSAEKALSCGLVSRLCSTDSLLQEVSALARQIAAKPPLAVQAIKRAVDRGLESGADAGAEIELLSASIVFDTEDRKEGMNAFIEKRDPTFKGM
ncbi:MAG: crotonase [Gammaproteobacteria bacterium]|nr:crotonase [Chromatiales bacterium]MYE49031.1 crotonase [Gammaproteobacteria bacterium]